METSVRRRYFVTGATGFIGGRIARRLVEQGDQVVALARDPAKAADLAALGVEVARGDVTDRESLRAPMTGVDGVFHIAAWYKVGARDVSPAERINVGGTRNVLETMRELGVPKGVYTSTLAVFSDTRGQVVDEGYRHVGPFISAYDRTKWRAHYEVALPLMESGLPLVIVQPGMVYGPGDDGVTHTLFVQYLKRRLLAVPKATAFCWGHVDDTARGHLLAMENGKTGESYIIAGPPYTLIDALTIAAQTTGVPAPKLHPPGVVVSGLASIAELIGRVVPLPEAYAGESPRVLAGATYLGSNAKARRELGFAPRSLEEGLPEVLRDEMRRLGMAPRAH